MEWLRPDRTLAYEVACLVQLPEPEGLRTGDETGSVRVRVRVTLATMGDGRQSR